MTFRSPYDREFEREQEIEHEAYQRGVDNILNKIRTEITAIAINGQVDEHTAFIRSGEQVKQMALNVIDKYMAKSRDKK